MQKRFILFYSGLVLVGIILGYFIFTPGQDEDAALTRPDRSGSEIGSVRFPNPFAAKDNSPGDDSLRIQSLEVEVDNIKAQLQDIEQMLQASMDSAREAEDNQPLSSQQNVNRNRFSSMLNQRLYNVDNLIRGGIDSATAEDIVRRKNASDLKRLQLQDRAKREGYFNSRRYYDELEEINSQDTTLREELGDDQYDEYLFNSKQNNRIRISSVMLGSAAEQAGIKRGDVVLSYDGQRMFNWQELKDATSQGELGEYVSVTVYRNGEVFSFSVPRGPLGMQLGATRLSPQ